VWRILRENNIVLKRHRSWCQSREPQFAEKVLRCASFNSTEELCGKIREFIDHYDEHPKPFVWRKREVRGTEIRDTITNLIN